MLTSEGHVEFNNIEPMNTPALPSNRKKKKKPQQTHTRIPFFITNLSSSSRVVLPKDQVVAFVTPEDPETNYMEIAEVQSVENECRNWKHPTKMLPKAPKSDFIIQSTRSSQAWSLKPTMQTSQNLLPHTPYHCPASKYVNYKNLMKNFACFAPGLRRAT